MPSFAILITTFILSVSAQTVVDLGYAQYQGTSNDVLNITNFLGIRFAAPPIGTIGSANHAFSICLLLPSRGP